MSVKDLTISSAKQQRTTHAQTSLEKVLSVVLPELQGVQGTRSVVD